MQLLYKDIYIFYLIVKIKLSTSLSAEIILNNQLSVSADIILNNRYLYQQISIWILTVVSEDTILDNRLLVTVSADIILDLYWYCIGNTIGYLYWYWQK